MKEFFVKCMLGLKPYGSLISFASALIIFLNWITTNYLQQQYESRQRKIEQAKQTFRQMEAMRALRQDLQLTASDVGAVKNIVNNMARELSPQKAPTPGTEKKADAQKQKKDPASPLEQLTDEQRFYIALEAHSFNQKGRRALFVHQELLKLLADFSNTLRSETEASKGILETQQKFSQLVMEMVKKEQEVGEAIKNALTTKRKEDYTAAEKSIYDYNRYAYVHFMPALASPEVIQTSVWANTRFLEGETELATFRTLAEWASGIAVFFYITGTALAILGKFAEIANLEPRPTSSTTLSRVALAKRRLRLSKSS
jgi:hypothetical protein